MDETDRYLRALLQQQGLAVAENLKELFQSFVCLPENINNVKNIRLLQERMTKDWKLIARRAEIDALQLAFPNAVVGKPYQAEFDFKFYGLDDIIDYNLNGFEGSGLSYDVKAKTINGIPKNSGDIMITFSYRFDGETTNVPLNQKIFKIIVNPDPKSLWKNIPSNTNDIYAKGDEVVEKVSFLDFTLIAASKRGRSHANKGSFRDDDYAYSALSDGWGVVAISDGAGSAKFSRKGAWLACNSVVNYFKANFTKENSTLLVEAIIAYQYDKTLKNKLLDIALPHLSAAARKAHEDIESFATEVDALSSDFHATLAFVLVKRFPQGYAFLSFGVGDCPLVLIEQSFEWVKPLNKLDVGEYGGGTRFITMQDIFTKNDFEERFNFEFTANLPYLVLMTDGIYDPKFEVEANLSMPEKWKVFFDDLKGDNNEGVNVLTDHENIDKRFSEWMDFWSSGNHDDRTLIVLY